ncbi:MAG TPA: glycosyltransferase family 2 protein [Candidatus Baltobacteraceae bacterium]|nr:glycosyltransferase family 2 protein [Candidatus Baltobacteraceae bacterium]
MQPQLSVVVPVYNNWWMTARLLAKLERLRDGLPFETIVVDNASTDETQHEIEGFAWVRYLRNEENLKFAGACNAGARAAETPLVLFLNNDAYPLGDALAPLIRAFEREEVAIAGGALFFEDGVTQCAGFVVLPNAHWHYSCRNLPHGLEGVTHSRDALGVSGAAMAVRTQWFLESGGFDESFVNGFEDVDLCLRAREAGRTIRYVAESRFAHYEGASEGRYEREQQNERRFYERWSPAFQTMPRVERGSVGAIGIHAPANVTKWSAAALGDLEDALRSFGHPVVRGGIKPWQFTDERFRRSASLCWFGAKPSGRSVLLERAYGGAEMKVRGAVELSVPWLPCASPERSAAIPLRRSAADGCPRIALAGASRTEFAATLDGDIIEVSEGRFPHAEVACVVVAGLTDDAAFGNVALAQAGVPAVVIADRGMERLYADDVALIVRRIGLADAVARFTSSAATRERYGNLLRADSLRRFNPRRTAIRVVDLLCAARFGFERPSQAKSNAPIVL